MSSALADLGLSPVINATGPWTKMGNSALSPGVIAAMNEAAGVFLPISELQERAGRAIATATGAESGYATPGASAGITLAVAACVAGENPARIKALPRRLKPPNQVVMFQQHRGYYDFSVRATGAKLRLIDAGTPDSLGRLGAALDGDVACVFYDCTGQPYKDQAGVPPLEQVVALAHQKSIRVIVDGSMALPPADNLRALVATGADAVVFTASKAMQGPAASGFVACRETLVRAMALQHQDVDVLAETTGVSDPLNRYMGLGRSLKVGKEQIVGMLVALEEYQQRNHARDQEAWRDRLEAIAEALADIDGVTQRWLISNEGRAPYLLLGFEGPLAGLQAEDISKALLAGEPRIFVAAHHGNTLWLGAENLHDSESPVVARQLKAAIQAEASGTP
ncbi:MAG: hypothetical protein AAF495_08450 [Pseudomonadota bacterium]